MTIRFLLFSTIIFLFVKCNFVEPSIKLKPPDFDINPKWLTNDLKTFIDPTLNDSIELSKLITAKSIDDNNIIKDIQLNHGLNLYKSITKSETCKIHPIFEIINSPFSILIVNGNGQWGQIWAKILINKESKKIIRISFDHKCETPGIGANFTDSIFENKFAQKTISFDLKPFELRTKNVNSGKAKYQIDAATGATITCDSAIQMINKEIIRFKNYLN